MKYLSLTFLLVSACSNSPDAVSREKSGEPDCSKNEAPALALQIPGVEEDDLPPVTYDQDIDPLFKKYCLSCHSGDEKDPNAPTIGGFKDLSADDFLLGRLAVSSVQSFQMPKAVNNNEEDQVFGGDTLMEPAERQLFLDWAQDGFRKDEDSKPLEDINWNISQKPTYDVNIAPILASTCQTCHADGQQPPELSDFEKMKAEDYKLALEIVVEVMEGDMPKLNPLPSSQRLMFQLWALQGFRQTQADPIAYRNQSLNEYLEVSPEESPDQTADAEPKDCAP